MKMKKKMILLVSLLLLTAAVLGGMPQDAWADTQSKEYVVDDAGLFTDKEKEQLTKMCRKASDACKTDVVILTQSKGLDDKELENDVRGIINESYGYDESSSEPDAIVYVIDMKSRADMLVTSGIARTTKSFTQSKLDAIREKRKISFQMAIIMQAVKIYFRCTQTARYQPFLQTVTVSATEAFNFTGSCCGCGHCHDVSGKV